MKSVLFYSSVKDITLFNTQKFYQIDIEILEELGYNVILSNKVYDSLKFWKYNFVVAYFYRWSFFVALIAKIFGRNTYFTGGIDALDKATNLRKTYIIQVLFFYLCHLVAKKCMIVSKADMIHVQHLIGKSKKLCYSEHSIDTSNFLNKKVDFKFKQNNFVTICWQGNQSNIERKGVDLAIKLYSELIKKTGFENSKFYILGRKGNGTIFLSQLIDKMELANRVIIVGEVSEDEKVDFLANNKFYFQLSQYEGFGLAALEALLSGDIIIHSGKGGLANPIFKDHIQINITDNIKHLVEYIYECLSSIDFGKIKNNYKRCLTFYDNSRRKNDFENILINEK